MSHTIVTFHGARADRLQVRATAVELNEVAACHAVVVAALTRQAASWRQRLGFHPFDPDEPEDRLHSLTSEIEADATPAPVADRPQGATLRSGVALRPQESVGVVVRRPAK